MLLFSHIGITLGSAAILAGVDDRLRVAAICSRVPHASNAGGKANWLTGGSETIGSCFESLARKIDIRALVVGALLPDIIDKPIGHWLLAGRLDNGRIFGHTLLLLLVMAFIGWLVFKRRGSMFVFAISFGVVAHLVLDGMWQNPQTLFWPLLGIAFPKGEPGNWLAGIIRSLTQPDVYTTEIIGLAICCAFGFWLIRKRAVFRFLRSGKVI